MSIDDINPTSQDRSRRVEPLMRPEDHSDLTRENSKQCPYYQRGDAKEEMFLGVKNVMCNLPQCPYGYNSKGFFEDEESTINICTVRGYIGKNLDTKI